MSTFPHDANLKHQSSHAAGERIQPLSNDPHARLPLPVREQSTLESLSSAFRGLGGLARASTQQSRTSTYASTSPHLAHLASPTFSNSLMLSDDDGGPEESLYGQVPEDAPDHDSIVWSGWDEVMWEGQSTSSRLLLLGYRGGLQVWDCSTEQVREVLNLLPPTIGTVVCATVLPVPAASQDDPLAEQRPLLGILTSRPDELVIYSLRTHNIINRIPFNSPGTIKASDQFLVVSTVSPLALHILHPTTFVQIHTISSPDLAVPIFSLSRRLLAYASSPPPPSTSPTPTPTTQSPSKVQADISMAIEGARKVGAGMWSGVKTLLGDSSISRSPAPYSPARSPAALSPTSQNMPISPRLYSRSAPSESTYSATTTISRAPLPTTRDPGPTSSQGHVTVLDLAPLHRPRSHSVSPGSIPRRIVQHHATPGQATSSLSFSRTGNMLAVSGADGVSVRLFEVRPKGRYSKGGPRLGAKGEQRGSEEKDTGILWHLYDLQRGVTRRRVIDIVWSADNKWITVVTVRGTLHVFAINPYGGVPNGASHLLGSRRIVNLTEPQRAPVSLSAILRIHTSTSNPAAGEKPSSKVPVSATFGSPSKSSRESASQDIFLLNQKTGELVSKQCLVRMQPTSTLERGMQGMQASISLPGAGISALSSNLSGNGMSALSNMMRGGSAVTAGRTSVDEGLGALALAGIEAGARTWGVVRREKDWGEVKATLEKAVVGNKPGKTKAGRSEWLAQAEITTCTRSLKLLPGPIYLSHQFTFHGLCEDWHALLRQAHLNLPAIKLTVRREVSARAIADTGSDGAFLGSGNDDTFATSSSLDAPLASALGASISPESASQQIPSFPNAYSAGRGASWKDPVKRLSHLSDGLGQGFESFRREIGKVERRVRSPTSPVTAVPGIKLEFDDNDAMFEADEDLPPRDDEGRPMGDEGVDGLRALREDDGSRSAESGSGSVPSTVPDLVPLTAPDLAEWTEDGGLNGEEAEYSRARDEDNRFDDLVGEWRAAGAGWSENVDHGAGFDLDDDVVAFDVGRVGVYDDVDVGTVGFMDEEEEDRRIALEVASAPASKKHRKKR